MAATPTTRPSLTITLEDRYNTQKVGSAFDVKKTLGGPGTVPAPGTTINATSLNGKEFQNPDGFEVGVSTGMTQLEDAQGNTSKQLSVYMSGFSDQKYDA